MQAMMEIIFTMRIIFKMQFAITIKRRIQRREQLIMEILITLTLITFHLEVKVITQQMI